MDRRPRARRPWLAAILGAICPGLGHAYAGRLIPAAWVFLGWLAVASGWSVGLRLGPRTAIAAGVLVPLYWVAQTVHAAVVARRSTEPPRAFLCRPVGLVALLVAGLLVNVAGRSTARRIATTYALLGTGMQPTLEEGDYLVVTPGPRAELGAVVVFHRGADGPIVGRIVGVGGDTIELRDGALVRNGQIATRGPTAGPCTYWSRDHGAGLWQEEACTAFRETLAGRSYGVYCSPDGDCGDFGPQGVPPGTVLVLGEYRDRIANSARVAPLAESAIEGTVSYVLFSWGPDGLRHERAGRPVE